MMRFAISGVTGMFSRVNDARLFAIVTCPDVTVVLTTTGQAQVLAPSWMWAAVMFEPAGNPPSVTAKFAVADVTLPALSRVVLSVMVAVPVTDDSAFVTGGTSFDGDNAEVKIGFVDGDGVFGD